MADGQAERFRPDIVAAFPELADAPLKILGRGWHSRAIEIDGRLVAKFPDGAEAEAALRREAALLRIVGATVTMTVPAMTLHEGARLFSRHGKIDGEHLLTDGYEALDPLRRDRLATELALFYAQLHAIEPARLAGFGVGPVEAWQPPDAVRDNALPLLTGRTLSLAHETVDAFEALPPDPLGTVYGFFDGHGWNMAFDHEAGRLNGIYDFADSGFGPRHQDFIYSSFVSPDLTARIVVAYGKLTGLALDPRRIEILTGMHRLSELAALADDPAHVGQMVGHVEKWSEAVGK